MMFKFTYNYTTLKHFRYNFVAPDNPDVHTQSIESAWQKFKQSNRHRYGTRRGELFMLFLVEHMWRKKFGMNNALYNLWKHISETFCCRDGVIVIRQDSCLEWDYDVFDDE